MIIVNGWKPLTIITKRSILDVAAVLDPPLVKVLYLPKNADILQKKGDISKIKGVLVLKGIFSETTYVRVLTYQVSNF